MAGKKRREWFVNLSIVMITVILCLLAFEGYLRFINLRPIEEGDIYESDPLLGRKLIPNSTGYRTYYGTEHSGITETITYKINSKGLRDEEYSYTKPENITRILLLGDSFTFGCEVNQEDTIDANMERMLNGCQVLNFGNMWYGTIQEFLLLREEGVKYDPDVVFTLLFTNNDGADNIDTGSGSKPVI
ncbi:SGNH/GDSL hydrolase family protein, partial [Methanophagales archaeon]